MKVEVLKRKIEKRIARICVVGLGYVGLPTALELARAGFPVSGYDVDHRKVDLLMKQKLPFGENERDLVGLFEKTGSLLTVSTDQSILCEKDIYIIAVATPLLPDRQINIDPLKNALKVVGKALSPAAIVIIESTSAPGTAQSLAVPILENYSKRKLNKDFFLLHCPERISPGETLVNLTTYPRVIGGSASEGAELGKCLYSSFCLGTIDLTDLKTAEVIKTAENADRDIRIALANEFAIICDAYEVNFQTVRKLINKMPGKDILQAGAGVGGHCIPKDPWLLIDRLKDKTISKLIPAARAVNDGMPAYVVKLLLEAMREVRAISLKGKKVAILGFTYREHTDDTRDSPTRSLIELLEQEGVNVVIHDPLVERYAYDVFEVVGQAYAVIFMVSHDSYKEIDLAKLKGSMAGKIIIDGRNVIAKDQAEALGFVYRGIGNV